MVWSGLVVHGSEKNVSNEARVTYMNGFCASNACSSFPDYLIDGKVVSNMNPKLIP
jgi:NADH:ubiquinone oxidoreductase subunit E